MGTSVDINDDTAFLYKDGTLIPVERGLDPTSEDVIRVRKDLTEEDAWMLVPEFIREKDPTLYHTVVSYALDQFREYLKVKADNVSSEVTMNKRAVYNTLRNDIESSELLQRLFQGKEALSEPPPKTYQSGWYNLMEDGEDVCIDVYITQPYNYEYNTYTSPATPYATIDGEKWDITEELPNDEYIVKYKDNSTLFKLSKMTQDDYARLLHPRLRRAVSGSWFKWKLTKVEQTDESV